MAMPLAQRFSTASLSSCHVRAAVVRQRCFVTLRLKTLLRAGRHASISSHITARDQHSPWLGQINSKPSRRSFGTTSAAARPVSAFQKKLVETESRDDRFRDFNLEGRVFVVTGGGRGLGLTLAEALVEAGGHVYCLDRLPEPHPDFHSVQGRVSDAGGGSLHYERVDIRDVFDVEDVIGRIAAQHERFDGLIAAAAIQRVQPALEYPPAAINEMLDVNYRGVYISAVSCAKHMIKYKCPGSIMLIASMSGLIANKGFTSSVYNSSKAAVIQLARSLAMEWGQIIPDKDGGPNRAIRVNALCPGNIVTPMVEKNFEDDPSLEELWKRENMMGRLSRPREYRGAALFLLSDASSFMTGSHLVIDGGYTAW